MWEGGGGGNNHLPPGSYPHATMIMVSINDGKVYPSLIPRFQNWDLGTRQGVPMHIIRKLKFPSIIIFLIMLVFVCAVLIRFLDILNNKNMKMSRISTEVRIVMDA